MSRREEPRTSRRSFLGALTLGVGATAFTARGAFADELVRTPRLTEGPFYPNKLPLDTDNDLIVLNDNLTPAVGEITHLSGRLLDHKGDPLQNTLIEIWQVDHNGAYIHTEDDSEDRRDKNFQGYGRFLTGSTGEYYFRTIKPVPYPGRCPHIHVKIRKGNKELLTTQFFVKGHPQNEGDFIWRDNEVKARDAITPEFKPIPGLKTGELAAKVDVVLGFTPKA